MDRSQNKNLGFQGITAQKMSKYGVCSGPYFPVFSPNVGKYGPEKSTYLDTFHVVNVFKWVETDWW